MASRRENKGFHLDSLARVVRYTALNEFLALPIAGAAHFLTLDSSVKYLTALFTHANRLGVKLNPRDLNLPKIARTALTLGLVGAAYSANEFLTKWTANNWTRNKPGEWKTLDKEIVLITGASSGIGEHTAKMLLAWHKGVKIVIVDFAPMSWEPSAADASRVFYFQADLSKPEVVRSVSKRIKKKVGHPTVLINNAGLARGFSVLEGSYADVEVTIKTNLQAPFLLIKEFVPHMAKTNHGHIVTICSMSAVVPTPGIVDYSATKAGVQALHEGLALELKHRHKADKVRLTNIIPNFIRTPLLSGVPRQSQFGAPLLHVETVAETIVRQIESGYGGVVYLPGIMRYITCLRALPEWVYTYLIRNGTVNLAVGFQGRQIIDENGGLRAVKVQKAEIAEKSDRSEAPEVPEKPEKSEAAERPEKAERPERPERAERSEAGERPERAERAERSERSERAERAERSGRSNRAERRARNERSEKSS
ncbi:uncharacterized protein QC763_513020 [Podospora pseudopauciseta]|uniref:Uncharacterized protein n=1 Tax=Podospora pseudopauciseta TaxID=2093780 RepID=A0ABR0H7V3_9PEZI|nr:hypothetical protein QC763_513020 [Podospora pseudopauciseta]